MGLQTWQAVDAAVRARQCGQHHLVLRLPDCGGLRAATQCIFYAHAWVDLPLTLMVTGVSVSLAFLFMPRLPGKSNPYLQVGQMLGHLYHIAKHRSDIDMRGTGVLHKSVLEAHLA